MKSIWTRWHLFWSERRRGMKKSVSPAWGYRRSTLKKTSNVSCLISETERMLVWSEALQFREKNRMTGRIYLIISIACGLRRFLPQWKSSVSYWLRIQDRTRIIRNIGTKFDPYIETFGNRLREFSEVKAENEPAI